ncbi:MAG: endo-1,4-beta-xylanase [Bacteroidaceae bacterium]|nr:endo-1,4-beta-xylanase [Bacteroidaceae bacterium]
MDFGTVQSFLDNAEADSMSVYGHTLAWHAQQPKEWFNTLMADVVFPHTPDYQITDQDLDFSQGAQYTFTELTKGANPKVVDGVLHAPFPGGKTGLKYYLTENLPVQGGKYYELEIVVKANVAGNLLPISAAGTDLNTSVEVFAEEATIVVPFNVDKETTSISIIANPARLNMTLDYTSIKVYHYYEHQQTPEEKKDTLTYAMNTWCNGMMNACKGRVLAWDLINEAVSGAGSIEGQYYDLQHSETASEEDKKNNFYWQDYFGSYEYGPIVEKAARTAFRNNEGGDKQLLLFVNDYNLESDWDDNKKLKSLIYWVNEWEKRGAKIDGLGTQMHISYYENESVMRSKAAHMVKMLHLMAETGKLVRISELDMGYVNANGEDVLTKDLTLAQRQQMAFYYRFIIQMYLKIVPAAQQYAICQWCLTDSPSNSGWRPGQPVGIWTEGWDRTAVYAAYCEALSEPLPNTEDFFEYLQQFVNK